MLWCATAPRPLVTRRRPRESFPLHGWSGTRTSKGKGLPAAACGAQARRFARSKSFDTVGTIQWVRYAMPTGPVSI